MTKYYRVINHRGKGHQTNLHTKEDCHRLQRGRDYKRVSRDDFPDSPICPTCAGTVERPRTQDRSHYQALLKAGSDD